MSEVRADSSGPVRKIGLIMPSRAGDARGQQQFEQFNRALARLGRIDGQNASILVRWSGGEPSLAKQFADEPVRLKPELIVAGSTVGLEAAQSATAEIPIVFVAVSDPVAAGYVKSLENPGGNYVLIPAPSHARDYNDPAMRIRA